MVDVEGIFIGANAQTSVSDLDSRRKIVAFGAGHTVALWKPTGPDLVGVYQTLKGHQGDVLGVKFLTLRFLVSVSADKSVRVWEICEDETFTIFQTIDHAHNGSVDCLATAANGVFVTSSTDGQIIIWKQNHDKFELVYKFFVKAGFYPLALSLFSVTTSGMVLVVGGTDSKVYVYSFVLSPEGVSGNVVQSAVLPGHENWVRTVAVRQEPGNKYLIASGSLDRYVRLWRLEADSGVEADAGSSQLVLLSNRKYKFELENVKFNVYFDALIMGHDDWISSLCWHPDNKLQLLSASADTSLAIWEPDASSGVWVCVSRLGELSIKGASTATGASGGLWSCVWFHDEGSDQYHVLTHGKSGSWRAWGSDDGVSWAPEQGLTGHAKEATDVCWAPIGYVLSTSLDQTTRLFAKTLVWKEFARPQIHGYDMICVSSLDNLRFVSGGDEKVLRSFEVPKSVALMLKKFAGLDVQEQGVDLPEAASLPTLGLSNKAENDGPSENDVGGSSEQENNISFSVLAQLQGPPTEDELQRHTLWPEIEKVYGHGYEIVSLDTSSDRKYVVSSCKANSAQHAVLRIFSTADWLEVKPALKFHDLTVTRVQFSPDDKYILAVSRDRKLSVWSKDQKGYSLACGLPKAHSRIIWDGAWAPEGDYFVTGSRDKSFKVWKFLDRPVEKAQVMFTESVTAVAVSQRTIGGKFIIAAGLENGKIYIYDYDVEKSTSNLIEEIDEKHTPAGRINRLAWHEGAKLAVASADHSVRIFSWK